MDYKSMMGYGKKKKKSVKKEQPKPKKNMIIEGIKKDLLKESYAWERKFGEKLPTLEDVKKKKLKEVGASVQHQDFLKKISNAEEEMHKYVQQYKNFLIDQDQKKLANEFSSKYVGFIGKFTHFMKTKWVKILRKLI